MTARRFFVKSRGKIYRRFYTDLMRRFDFGAEKVEIQSRMHFVRLGRMICPSVMAFGKYRDRIHMTDFERTLELFL